MAYGRLEWLTRRLRAHLSSELASALRQVDPLAAGSGDAQGGGGGGEGVLGLDEERRRDGLGRIQVRFGEDTLEPRCCWPMTVGRLTTQTAFREGKTTEPPPPYCTLQCPLHYLGRGHPNPLSARFHFFLHKSFLCVL